ncbi:tRNA (adenosine(37)-N6)-threonylcarbamoyltransferase complex dimerization subunit type 1 TsaB [Kordiimonas sp. SCSIO 12603]|uniref:tRNA (adenosine(37)-N6)-threonylcarbamoyltransferase complex dimerization subunit type 1 TsaB n=1 Tax=Kordiimonas sp. SCSIO 12603 TaxID=2829596 RepID=UPI002106F38C|nr:tRNA (adenosine(37)-N6)-threonylcarbamoyltransferase complex dimerization subunit type 1 TsaB [Kordiimonas sp. SCSIO 12603]UTW58646.1 tRNA (adenosine(37)-N6)-threonylcarbamoyltransferase complex dimerization subunit type 1 TsaB [Kordiimonas sp. SCSIO 12603]
MAILAIDTCESYCSSAVLLASGEMFSSADAIGRGHAEHLIPQLEGLMEQAGISYADITRVAVTTGPGTFTGLRIGLSVARGIALAQNIPCVGLTALSVLAAQAQQEKPGRVYSVMKGRGGQVFLQAFVDLEADGLPKMLGEPMNIDEPDALQMIEDNPGRVVGSGAALLELSTEHDHVDPAILARIAQNVNPKIYPPEPTYYRQADAAKAKRLIPIGDS